MSVDLEKLNIIIESNSKGATNAVDELVSSLNDLKSTLGGLSTSGKQGANGIKTATEEIRDLGKVSSESKQSSEELADANEKVSTSANKAGKSSKDAGKDIKNAGNESKSAAEKLKGLWSSFARIAMYRAIRTALKAITTAVKEGFNAFYEWDKESNNGAAGFAQKVDDLKRAWQELVGAIGPAIAAIWNIVGPALTFIVHILTEIVDTIQQIVRALQGETTWYKAVWREGKKATEQAKELQRVLFGFDELNVLPSDHNGGTTGTLGYLDYERREIPDWMKKIQGFFHGWTNEQDKNTESQKENEKQTKKTSEAYRKFAEDANRLGFSLPFVGEGLRGVQRDGENTKNWFAKNPIPVYFEEKSPTAQEIWNSGKNTLSQPITVPTAVATPAASANNAFNTVKRTLSKLISIPTTVANPASAAAKAYSSVYKALNIPITIPTKIGDPTTRAMIAKEKANQVFKDPINIPTSVDVSQLALVPGALSAMQSILNANPLKFISTFSTEGVSSAVNAMWTAMQKFFNANPITIAFKVGNETTQKASTTAKSKNLWADEKSSLTSAAASKAAQTATLVNPWAGMSATDLVNYAQSTGLNMTAADKKVAAITAATIATPVLAPAALAVGTGAGGAVSLVDLVKNLAPILGFASGGVPSMGTLFYAGERGAEVVADMGSRTGVMNVSQMEAAVASGNESVVNALYSAAATIVNAFNNKSFDVYMDSAKVGKSVTNYQNNAARRTGTPQIIGG